MIEKCNESRAKTYYCRKYHWTSDQFQSINWDIITSSMTKCNVSTAKWVSKFSCGFVGTAKTLARREYWLGSHCPLCNNTDEDNTHIICCPHPPHRERVLNNLQDLYEWMEFINFPPTILDEIKRANEIWLNDQTLSGITSHIPCIQSQIELGWQHFIYGRTHVEIAYQIQCHYDRTRHRRSSQQVLSQLIYRLWTKVIRPQWNARNKIVHALDVTTTQTREHSDLIEEVTERYQSTNSEMLAYEDRKLFTIPLDELKLKPVSYLKAWNDSVDIAIRSSSMTSNNMEAGQRLLTAVNIAQNNITPENTTTHMTPVQRRVHRQQTAIPDTVTPPIPQRRQPLDTPAHPVRPSNGQTTVLTRRRNITQTRRRNVLISLNHAQQDQINTSGTPPAPTACNDAQHRPRNTSTTSPHNPQGELRTSPLVPTPVPMRTPRRMVQTRQRRSHQNRTMPSIHPLRDHPSEEQNNPLPARVTLPQTEQTQERPHHNNNYPQTIPAHSSIRSNSINAGSTYRKMTRPPVISATHLHSTSPRQRQRRHSTSPTSDTTPTRPTQLRNTLPRPSAQNSRGTLLQFWSPQRERNRLRQGSWRPP